jgi:hypothetical protein
VSEVHGSTRPGRIAFAVIRRDPPEVFVAEDEFVLTRLLALNVVATSRPESLPSREVVEDIRTCLLEERWGDAVVRWLECTDEAIDAYPDEEIWTEARLDGERASLEVRMAPLFED